MDLGCMAKTQGYRQQSPSSLQGSTIDALGTFLSLHFSNL
jgi:ribosomal protein L32E